MTKSPTLEYIKLSQFDSDLHTRKSLFVAIDCQRWLLSGDKEGSQ